jgi:cellulose synthase/poly-beta-1,6-N-acetylglucosamine synthase-like glycosyltransferase
MRPNYTFTYVIGYRHKADRLQNLRKVLDWINGFQGVEVLLIEQDKHSKISQLNLKAKHHFLKSNMPYNKSWSFNYATKIAQSDIIVFADSDLIMNPNQLIEALNQVKDFEMVNPYYSVIDLNQQESNFPFEQMIQIDRPGRGETDHQKVPICGGICIFRREALQKIGGWSEQYVGWGAEDDHISVKVKHFLNWTELKNKCYHLFHTRENPDMNLYQRNLQLLNRTANLSKEEVMKEAMMATPRMGMKNKYSTF